MAATLKATWPAFEDMEFVSFAALVDGAPLASSQLPGDATEAEFYAEHYPASTYTAHARGVTCVIPCGISEVQPGGGG